VTLPHFLRGQVRAKFPSFTRIKASQPWLRVKDSLSYASVSSLASVATESNSSLPPLALYLTLPSHCSLLPISCPARVTARQPQQSSKGMFSLPNSPFPCALSQISPDAGQNPLTCSDPLLFWGFSPGYPLFLIREEAMTASTIC
jgi:hypothetical protein